jgi:hypothetical protein
MSNTVDLYPRPGDVIASHQMIVRYRRHVDRCRRGGSGCDVIGREVQESSGKAGGQCLEDNDAQPDADVCGNQMHEAEATHGVTTFETSLSPAKENRITNTSKHGMK